MVRYLIQQGYTVFEFQSESELGAWLADQFDGPKDIPLTGDDVARDIIGVLNEDTKVLHAIHQLSRCSNGRHYVTTECGVTLTILRTGGIIPYYGDNGTAYRHVTRAIRETLDSKAHGCGNCARSRSFAGAWDTDSMEENISRNY